MVKFDAEIHSGATSLECYLLYQYNRAGLKMSIAENGTVYVGNNFAAEAVPPGSRRKNDDFKQREEDF